MKTKSRADVERALAARGGDFRFFLLCGPDRSSSEALAGALAKAMGADAERIDLTGAELRGDPARLADEAASISMFGEARHIRIDPAGEEILGAVEALLEAPAAGNPVVAVAGDLAKTSKLLKLASDHAAAMAFVSYLPDARDARRLAFELGQSAGLRLGPDQAARLADASGGDRAILSAEIEKLALYADASPERPREATHAMIDALGAESDEGDAGEAVNFALDGDARALDAELARIDSVGGEPIVLVRALLRRLTQLARLRAEVERGNSAQSVVARARPPVFWKERDRTVAQLQRWRGDTLARAIARALAAERALKGGGGAGTAAAAEELFALARQAQRLR